MFMPAAQHGAEASLVAVGSLCTAFVRAAWSTRLVVANFGVVFLKSALLLDGCYPDYHFV